MFIKLIDQENIFYPFNRHFCSLSHLLTTTLWGMYVALSAFNMGARTSFRWQAVGFQIKPDWCLPLSLASAAHCVGSIGSSSLWALGLFTGSVQFSSVAQTCPTPCDPKGCARLPWPFTNSRALQCVAEMSAFGSESSATARTLGGLAVLSVHCPRLQPPARPPAGGAEPGGAEPGVTPGGGGGGAAPSSPSIPRAPTLPAEVAITWAGTGRRSVLWRPRGAAPRCEPERTLEGLSWRWQSTV